MKIIRRQLEDHKDDMNDQKHTTRIEFVREHTREDQHKERVEIRKIEI